MAGFSDTPKPKNCGAIDSAEGDFETIACQPSGCGPHAEESTGDRLLAGYYFGHYKYCIKLQPMRGEITEQHKGDYEDRSDASTTIRTGRNGFI